MWRNICSVLVPDQVREKNNSAKENGPFPFYMKFEKIQNRQKFPHSMKEHPMFTKIAKFGCEML